MPKYISVKMIDAKMAWREERITQIDAIVTAVDERLTMNLTDIFVARLKTDTNMFWCSGYTPFFIQGYYIDTIERAGYLNKQQADDIRKNVESDLFEVVEIKEALLAAQKIYSDLRLELFSSVLRLKQIRASVTSNEVYGSMGSK